MAHTTSEPFEALLRASRHFQNSLEILENPVMADVMGITYSEYLTGRALSLQLAARFIMVRSEEAYIDGQDAPDVYDPSESYKFDRVAVQGLFNYVGYLPDSEKPGSLAWAMSYPEVLNGRDVDEYEIPELFGDHHDIALPTGRPLAAPMILPVPAITAVHL